MSAGAVVTFYSYKGGVGRTLALANIGSLLASWGYKILCIDWDLEAPGLHLYFKNYIPSFTRPGLVDLLKSCTDEPTNWREHVETVTLQKGISLSLITAGGQDDGYTERVQGLNWKDLYEQIP